jgi:hypothetical protein
MNQLMKPEIFVMFIQNQTKQWHDVYVFRAIYTDLISSIRGTNQFWEVNYIRRYKTFKKTYAI